MIQSSRLLRVALLGTVLTAMCTIGASAATLGAGTVTADALRLRSTPAAEGEILATVSSGTSVVVLNEAEDGWYKVNYNSVEGYMSGEYLDVATKAETDLGYGQVDADGSTLNMRAGASTSFDSLCSIPSGTVLELEGVYEGWYKVTYAGNTGYVSSDYITINGEQLYAASAETSDYYVFAAVKCAVACRTRRHSLAAVHLGFSLRAGHAGRRACSDYDFLCLERFTALAKHFFCFGAEVHFFDDGVFYFRTEFLGLFAHFPKEVEAVYALGESGEVFDVACRG